MTTLTTLTAAASDTTPLQKTDKPIAVCTVDNYRFLAFKNGIAVVEMFDASRKDYIVDWRVIRLDRLGAIKYHFSSQSPESCVSVISKQEVLKMPWAVRLLVEVEDEKEHEQDEQYRRGRIVNTEAALDALQYRNYLYGMYGTAVDEFVTTNMAMFQVPPHLVQDLKRSTFNNIEHQGIAFVQYSLMPWIIRIEKGIMKDLLLEEEQDTYFPKFKLEGLMRGDYQSRMNAYAIGVGNGFMSPNDVRRLENMDLIPDDQGGNDFYLNGSYNKLQNAGAAYGLTEQSEDDDDNNTPEQEQPDESKEDTEPDNKHHAEQHEKRKVKQREGVG